MPRNYSLYFDAKDHYLLDVVNSFSDRDPRLPVTEERSFFHAALHPNGIKELAMSREVRVAYAVLNLLDSLEAGQGDDRIAALRALHKEVLSSSSVSFRHNTGRVLIQIMKSLIRAKGNTLEQLRLAHDFRFAMSGKRRIVRKLLDRYFLLEMPESWTQEAFDNHVHDANTKGRKSPTHLIMDAWIKGLRQLDVVYYNFVEPAVFTELLQAAEIVGIRVRVGLEFQVRFRNRFVQFIWQPEGFADWREMLAFFAEEPCRHLERMGREASLYHHDLAMRLLEVYNTRLRFDLGAEYGVELAPISQEELRSFVGIGQTRHSHLAELIYRRIHADFASQMDDLHVEYASGDAATKDRIRKNLEKVNRLTPDSLCAIWLGRLNNPDLFSAGAPDGRSSIPEIMRLLPETLIDWLVSMRTPSNIILNLSTLTVEDVLELLYDCDGMITHLEMYNHKNYEDGKMADIEAISELQAAINSGSIVALKRLIRNIIREANCFGAEFTEERCETFMAILRNIPKLLSFYAGKPLGTRIGSDSTSRFSKTHGMGFAFLETLPPRARKAAYKKHALRQCIPFHQAAYARTTFYPRRYHNLGLPLTRLLRKLPGLSKLGMLRQDTWLVDEKTTRYDEGASSITRLGGFQQDTAFNFVLEETRRSPDSGLQSAYINTTVKNIAKVVFGFSLALTTFLHTQSWWLLAWFGPVIWFGITGFRNVLQAVLGGGGLRRTPLLRWNDYVSWSRLCDSLMYTGISVPLLEYGMRTLLLEEMLGITSLSAPVIFYSIMSAVNGIYISTHNIYRGFPKEAVIGNLFRSVLAIPVSVAYNYILLHIFIFLGWPVPYLVEMGTVVSKMASDSVAAAIEGLADKAEFLRMRDVDYNDKLKQLLDCYARFEVLMPEEDVAELLRRPKIFMPDEGKEAKEIEKTIIVNALDLMYFWMYQPRARSTLARLINTLSDDELTILANAQVVLTRVHEVSQLLVDGLVGANFARPLSFYLDRYQDYLRDMSKLTGVEILHPESKSAHGRAS